MSGAASIEETRLTMGRWQNTYVVDSGILARHAGIRDVFDRIDRCVAEGLPTRCAQSLFHTRGPASPAVWRIRKLDLSFMVDVSAPGAGDVTESLSHRLVDGIFQITERGVESEGVLCFPDRAAYLAQFVLDLAAGRAMSKWYYEEFQSLDQLATGRAMVEALTSDPEVGVETLLHLARSCNLEKILSVLTDNDARMICEACFASLLQCQSNRSSSLADEAELRRLDSNFERSGTSSELSQWSGRLMEIWSEEPMRATGLSPADDHDALRWIAKTALRFSGAARDSAALAALNGLLALRRVLAAIPSPLIADRLVRNLTQGKMSLDEAIVAARSEGPASPEVGLRFLDRIARSDPDWAAQAAAVLLREKRPVAAVCEGESMITLCGGAFLIAPALHDLHLKEISEAAAGNGEQSPGKAAFFRYLVLARCLGRPLALQAWSDPALQLLSGCGRASPQQEDAFPPTNLARAYTVFAERLIAQSPCEGLCLVAETIDVPERESEILLLRDGARNAWIYACPWPHDFANHESTLLSAIEFVHRLTGNMPHILLRSSLATLADSRALQKRTISLVPLDSNEIGGEVAAALSQAGCAPDSTPPEKIARLLAPADLEFACFSAAIAWEQFDPALDLLTALISRAAFRAFACRLMGFQSSSPEHIYRNFLEGVATVRNRSERIEVDLPRCPLSLVLQLAGLDRQSYTVPWLEGREICLLPPRE